jgi:hypothetical protein
LEIVPGDIVGGVTKKNPGNFYDMLEHLRGDSIKQPFARWYCHVKWGHSNGGHEFLIVKVDEDAFNIMDPQQGVVRPLTADDSYMKNVDWEGTYICRIDDKPFKYMEFDKINDPSKILPWDPKKDIPYMIKHGLCTKEEAERELKHSETMEFYKELKKALGRFTDQFNAPYAGATIVYKQKKPVEITVQGNPIDDNRLYTLVTVDFISEGGDHLLENIQYERVEKTATTLRDFLITELKAMNARGEKVVGKKDGRAKMS